MSKGVKENPPVVNFIKNKYVNRGTHMGKKKIELEFYFI